MKNMHVGLYESESVRYSLKDRKALCKRYIISHLIGFLLSKQNKSEWNHLWLYSDKCGFAQWGITLSLLIDSWFYFFPFPTAIRGELQPQLFVLELLQANHDWLLVDPGLPFAEHQPNTHHMLLHPSHQLCRPNGPRGCQGRLTLHLLSWWFTLRILQLKKKKSSSVNESCIY